MPPVFLALLWKQGQVDPLPETQLEVLVLSILRPECYFKLPS